MTSEEKARAYDEAIGKAQNILHTSEFIKITDLFPNLVESEDERIRKAIVGLIEELQRSDKYFAGVELTDMLAYLEKQKDIEDRWIEDRGQCFWDGVEEGKMLAEKQKEQKVDIDKLRRDLYQSGYNDGYQHGKEDAQKEPHYTKRNALFDKCVENCDPAVMKKVSDEVDEMLEKEQKPIISAEESLGISQEEYNKIVDECIYGEQKEQKPAEWSEEDEKFAYFVNQFLGYHENADPTAMSCKKWFNNRLKSIKPQSKAEWSEEDEMILEGIINTLDRLGYVEFCKSSRDEDIEEERLYFKEIQCLKKLKSLRPQPKQEWSEEDEDFINMLILHFNYLIDKGGDSVETYKSYIEKLKSLRPSWKPSEKQMKALEDAFRKDGSDEYRKTINSLYQDLKKLM